MIFGELETQTGSAIHFVNNTLLVIFKEDLIIFSYDLQESVKDPDVLAAFSTDQIKCKGTRSKCLKKHNNSLCKNSTYINSMTKCIISSLGNLKNENISKESAECVGIFEILNKKNF